MRIFIDFLTQINKNEYKIEGYIEDDIFPDGLQFYAVSGTAKIPLDLIKRQDHNYSFETTVPLDNNTNIYFVSGNNIENPSIKLHMGPHVRLANLLWSYRIDKSRIFVRYPRSIKVQHYTKKLHIISEARFLFRLLGAWQLRHAAGRLVRKYRYGDISIGKPQTVVKESIRSVGVVIEAIVMIPRAFVLRTAYHIVKSRVKRPIWLVSDRAVAAGDNGEALFRYIVSQKDCPADVYFVISRKSKDYTDLQKIGNVLDQSSLKYKLKFLFADKIISSQANVETTNPFIRQADHFTDLYTFDFVFLQHGVIRHDLSKWLNRYNKNIRLFITTAKKEYDSILNNPYYYPKENILLSGQPRYDLLENRPNKKLILSPTYRNRLALKQTNKRGERKYDPSFKKSEYRNFYNNLMNDSRIVGELKKQNMIGEFYLHPVFEAQRPDFDENTHFKVMRFPYNYKKAFSEGELLISDHSSVVFDFVYLKKPTVYAHFDVDTFFDGHSYEKSNFFSDEDDGFGGVYYDYETLVEGVVDLLKNGRKMPEKYRKRVDKFFYKVDKHNCQRVYQAILDLK